MLGPSIIGAVTPFAFAYSLFAHSPSSKRALTYPAMIISALELIVILYAIIGGIVAMARSSS